MESKWGEAIKAAISLVIFIFIAYMIFNANDSKKENSDVKLKNDSIIKVYIAANDSLDSLLHKIQADKDNLLKAVGKMKPQEVKNVILDRIIVPVKITPTKVDGTQTSSSEQSTNNSMVCYTNEQNTAIAEKLIVCDSESASKPIIEEKSDLKTKVTVDTFSVVLAAKNEEIKELKKTNLKDKIYMYSAVIVSAIVVVYAAFH